MDEQNNVLDYNFLNELSLEDTLKFSFNLKFSKCLIKKRKELGWTQEVLAEKSGVNRVTIAKIEKFQRTASIEVILKLLYALGMSLEIIDLEKNK